MTPTEAEKLAHFKWAIESRARNQRCALQLLEIFLEYKELWTTARRARAAQDLLSVSFALWRAAFLADKTAKRAAVFKDAVHFLEKSSRTTPSRTYRTGSAKSGHSTSTPELPEMH